MFDLKSVELELYNARQARIAAELACCDVEELAAAIRQLPSKHLKRGYTLIEMLVVLTIIRHDRRPGRAAGARLSGPVAGEDRAAADRELELGA